MDKAEIPERFAVSRTIPAVVILTAGTAPEEMAAPLLWGLEEEGIPAILRAAASGPAERLADRASRESPLNVGVGLDGCAREAVLHHRDLPPGSPLMTLGPGQMTAARMRLLGANAARLVKGDPLLFEEARVTSTGRARREEDWQTPLDPAGLEAVIVRVLRELTSGR